MKKKIFYILPILFIGISCLLIYQTRNTRNEYRETVESSNINELSAFDQLQMALNKDLIDLGEALISFVHFEDANAATVSTNEEEFTFPLTIVDREANTFSLADIIASPDTFVIGDTFGLATDASNYFYYYRLD
ncbi:hypothetical protein A5882_003822 [Enterococcus sp. 4E1_DIV0656]|uniref:hypothetical protein n=1 Tax=Enterococcus sp. 4E1_DIV0656 TaxID=1834180 RepID=UPI000A3A7888|nr:MULTISPECIES: hypothetical protein [Enterococcus]MDO7872887.1 hypothetical protein [Enterococcus casseliflavus]OTO08350.1 hypothetical protein A5882_003822 [Enterococcus sp. 4E1_DIV0656]